MLPQLLEVNRMKLSNRWKEQIPTLCIIGAQAAALVVAVLLVLDSPPGASTDLYPETMDSPASPVADPVNVAQAPSQPR
jgi:hypothetical protein